MLIQSRRMARSMLAAVAGLACAGIAFAQPAARVEFSMGEVTALSAGGVTRALAKGAEVASGDTVRTGGGRAQLRFSDGAYVSLQPQTEFRIDDYRFEGRTDGSERGFFTLLRGGLRTITGLVGRTSRKAYQVNTAVATIGIRGTEYSMLFTDGLQGSVGEGQIEVCNAGGCLPVVSGESYLVLQPEIKPVVTSRRTELPPPPPGDPRRRGETPAAGDITNEQGRPEAISHPPSGPGYMLAFAKQGGGGPAGRSTGTGTAQFDDRGQLIAYTSASTSAFTKPLGFRESGSDVVIAWGKWIGGYLQNGATFPLLPNQGFHYVVGAPTPAGQLGNGKGFYTLMDATNPTGDNDRADGRLLGARLGADFTLGKVGLDLAFQYAGNTYVMQTPGGALNPGSSTMVITPANAGFIGSIAPTGCAAAGCGGSVGGFFAGPNAERAGLYYNISDFAGGTFNAGGVVVLKREP